MASESEEEIFQILGWLSAYEFALNQVLTFHIQVYLGRSRMNARARFRKAEQKKSEM